MRKFNIRKAHVQSVVLKSDQQPILRSIILRVKDPSEAQVHSLSISGRATDSIVNVGITVARQQSAESKIRILGRRFCDVFGDSSE